MPDKRLHIISFENPYPADYGGVIDVFYKIKALHEIGYRISLHIFTSARLSPLPELTAITEEIFVYRKRRNPFHFFSKLPFSVRSRSDRALMSRLLENPAPVLFEGLQTTLLATHRSLEGYEKYLRLHNLESAYYNGLATSSTNLLQQSLYGVEAMKYRWYEKKLSVFKNVFALSLSERDYVNTFHDNGSYVPVFHGNGDYRPLAGFGSYAVYHGDLRISDNLRAAKFLIDIFRDLPECRLVIASGNGQKEMEAAIGHAAHISFRQISDADEMRGVLEAAHISVMMSFQQSGTKLKLVNSLFQSRHCLINENMADDERLTALCSLASDKADFKKEVRRLMAIPFDGNRRREVLSEVLDDHRNAVELAKAIFL